MKLTRKAEAKAKTSRVLSLITSGIKSLVKLIFYEVDLRILGILTYLLPP